MEKTVNNRIVSQEQWVTARKQLLEKEKTFTRERDRLSEERQQLPWVRIQKDYLFDGPDGKISLSDFFHGRSQTITTYHYEASIAFLHCTAGSFATTNWPLISSLYQKLLQLNPNPFIELNYAIALYFAGKKHQAMGHLHSLRQHPFLNSYYLLNAALGKIYLLEGDAGKARIFFLKTLEQTNSEPEKKFILNLLKKTDNL